MGFDRNLERAAMSAGAGPLRTFWCVTLPVLRPGILVGALLAFLHSFDETVVALFIAGRDASTLPKKMFESVRLEADPDGRWGIDRAFGGRRLHAALHPRGRRRPRRPRPDPEDVPSTLSPC